MHFKIRVKKKVPRFSGDFEFIVILLYNIPLLKSRRAFKKVVVKVK
jgi:hypothetical protein